MLLVFVYFVKVQIENDQKKIILSPSLPLAIVGYSLLWQGGESGSDCNCIRSMTCPSSPNSPHPILTQ